MREFYSKRSGVAHGGKKAITDVDLYTLVNITGTVIMIVIEKLKDMLTKKELMAWIEEKKLS